MNCMYVNRLSTLCKLSQDAESADYVYIRVGEGSVLKSFTVHAILITWFIK